MKNGYDSVMKHIQNAIVRGELYTHIEGSINAAVVKKLQDDGYIVCYDRNEAFTKVRWD